MPYVWLNNHVQVTIYARFAGSCGLRVKADTKDKKTQVDDYRIPTNGF
jgi:hypothetical protein